MTPEGQAPGAHSHLVPWMCQAMEARERGSAAWSDLGLPLFLVCCLIVNAPIVWGLVRWMLMHARPSPRERVRTGAWMMGLMALWPILSVLTPLASGFVDLGTLRGGSLIRAVRDCDPGAYWLGLCLLWLPFPVLAGGALSFVVRLGRTPYRKHVQHQKA